MSTRSYSEHESMQPVHLHKSSNKRKREASDHTASMRQPGPRPAPASNSVHGNGQENVHSSHDAYSNDSNNHDFTTMTEELSRHMADVNANAAPTTAAAALAASMPQLTVPQPTDFSFSNSGSGTDPDRQLDSSFDMGGGSDEGQNHHTQGTPYNLEAYQGGAVAHGQDTDTGGKPPVGSEQWHKVRRDNHKEVERRRRETINEGINELAKIVPGCEKNKGSILQRGVEYITQLKDNEARNIEKWTIEKLLTDQAISELSSSVDRLKEELQRTHREVARWRTTCQNAGLEPKDEDSGGTDDGET
ncbi:hypothetical protein BDR22DRAFT_541696 [Usnea florida]